MALDHGRKHEIQLNKEGGDASVLANCMFVWELTIVVVSV